MVEIIPTVVPVLSDDVRAAAARFSFVGVIHIDAGDGRFVPNTTWQPDEGETLPSSVAWEAHLMTESPSEIGIRYAKAGASRIIAHLEAFPDQSGIPEAFAAWKAAGAREVGLAVKIDTSLETLAPFALLCDVITIMTISTIGQQGSPFDSRALERIQALHAQFPQLTIAADGGINEANIPDIVKAGASRLCVGSALASSHDPQDVYRRLAQAAMPL